jgi:putative flippase GtrA
VDIVVPVYNEEDQLAESITALRTFLDSSFPFVATVTIADNASTDDTWRIATELAADLDGVSAIRLDKKGRGRALRAAWSRSTASVVSYMDVDLATGLDALLPLVAPLLSGHSDVAIGTRLGSGAHVVRGARREFISRGYNVLLRTALRSECTDAQCGFKAMRRQAALELLPLIEDDEWFFDTEVLVTAQRIGLRIHEVPVDWVDDTDTRVEVLHTALKDLRGIWRMLGPTSRQRAVLRPARPSPAASAPSTTAVIAATPVTMPDGPSDRIDRVDRWIGSTDAESGSWSGTRDGWHDRAFTEGRPISFLFDRIPDPVGEEVPSTQVFADELLRFAGVGAVSTVAYAGMFAALEPGLGSYLANGVAIGLCSLGNTAAHRGMSGSARHGLDRTHRMVTATALLGVSLAFTTGALAATRAVGLTSLFPELCAVSVANVGAAVIRFGILRTWVFRPEFGTHLAGPSATPAEGTHRSGIAELTRTPS